MKDYPLPLPSGANMQLSAGTIMATEITEDIALWANNLVSQNLAKADAMVAAVTGEQHDGFARLSDEITGNFLWTVSGLLSDANRAFAMCTAYEMKGDIERSPDDSPQVVPIKRGGK